MLVAVALANRMARVVWNVGRRWPAGSSGCRHASAVQGAEYFPDEAAYEYEGSYIGDAAWNEETRAEISREGDEYWQRDITL